MAGSIREGRRLADGLLRPPSQPPKPKQCLGQYWPSQPLQPANQHSKPWFTHKLSAATIKPITTTATTPLSAATIKPITTTATAHAPSAAAIKPITTTSKTHRLRAAAYKPIETSSRALNAATKARKPQQCYRPVLARRHSCPPQSQQTPAQSQQTPGITSTAAHSISNTAA